MYNEWSESHLWDMYDGVSICLYTPSVACMMQWAQLSMVARNDGDGRPATEAEQRLAPETLYYDKQWTIKYSHYTGGD